MRSNRLFSYVLPNSVIERNSECGICVHATGPGSNFLNRAGLGRSIRHVGDFKKLEPGPVGYGRLNPSFINTSLASSLKTQTSNSIQATPRASASRFSIGKQRPNNSPTTITGRNDYPCEVAHSTRYRTPVFFSLAKTRVQKCDWLLFFRHKPIRCRRLKHCGEGISHNLRRSIPPKPLREILRTRRPRRSRCG